MQDYKLEAIRQVFREIKKKGASPFFEPFFFQVMVYDADGIMSLSMALDERGMTLETDKLAALRSAMNMLAAEISRLEGDGDEIEIQGTELVQ